jgi:hypothetical protein
MALKREDQWNSREIYLPPVERIVIVRSAGNCASLNQPIVTDAGKLIRCISGMSTITTAERELICVKNA